MPPPNEHNHNYLAYYITKAELCFDFRNIDSPIIKADLTYSLDQINGKPGEPLILNGRDLTLMHLSVNNSLLTPEEYSTTSDNKILTINNIPTIGTIQITVRKLFNPKSKNGLNYISDVMVTDCSGNGFEHIMYFVKRIDNRCIFNTSIIYEPYNFPMIRTLGNLIKDIPEDDFSRRSVWEDSTLKQCSEFQLIAGILSLNQARHYSSISQHEVQLNFYTLPNRTREAPYFLRCLSDVMSWYENTFGVDCNTDNIEIIAIQFADHYMSLRARQNLFNDKKIFANLNSNTEEECLKAFGLWAWNYFDSQANNSSIENGVTRNLTRLYTDSLFGFQRSRIFTIKSLLSNQPISMNDIYLIANNDDLVNKWLEIQNMLIESLCIFIEKPHSQSMEEIPCYFNNILLELLLNPNYNNNYKYELLSLPEKSSFMHITGVTEKETIDLIYDEIETIIGKSLEHFWYQIFKQIKNRRIYEYTPETYGVTKLKNLCIHYLSKINAKYLLVFENQMLNSPLSSKRITAKFALNYTAAHSGSNTSVSTLLDSRESEEEYSSDSSDETSYYYKERQSNTSICANKLFFDKRLQAFKKTGIFRTRPKFAVI